MPSALGRLLSPLALCALAACAVPVDELRAPEVGLEAPETVDLGWIPSGETILAEIEVTNAGQVPVVLSGALPVSRTPPGLELELDPAPQEQRLGPGERAAIVVRVRGERALSTTRLGRIRVQVLGLSVDDPRLPEVELVGRVSVSGLAAEPNPLTIGPVDPLSTASATVALRNLRSRPVEVYSLLFAGGRARFEEAVTLGRFAGLPPVGPRGRLATLAPGEAYVVELFYTAPDGSTEAKEQAIWPVTTCAEDASCALPVIVQGLPDLEGPRLEAPSQIAFGQVPVGAELERRFEVRNRGRRPLTLSDLRFEGDPRLSVELAAASIPPDGSIEGRARFSAVAEGIFNGRLRFATNDPLNRSSSIRVSAAAAFAPPCAVRAEPSVVDFGVVEVRDRERRSLIIRSVGRQACLLFDPQIIPDEGVEPETFVFDRAPRNSVRLDPGRSVRFDFGFEPERPGPQRAVFSLGTGPDDRLQVPLVGRTPAERQLSCSPGVVTNPGGTVQLRAVLPGDAPGRYRWRVIRPPSGSTPADWSFSPNAETGPDVEFTPERIGTFGIEAEVQTPAGETFRCETEVDARSSGLRASLTWDGPGDLDLHLHRGARGPWFGRDDCYFDNLTPVWVPGNRPGEGPNPRHGGDDTSGDGPEQIALDEPEIGVVYTLGVSHFERAAGRVARVAATCGRSTATLDIASRPFRGSGTGNCSGNDFWVVATLVFTAPDRCDVERVDEYRTTRQACEGY